MGSVAWSQHLYFQLILNIRGGLFQGTVRSPLHDQKRSSWLMYTLLFIHELCCGVYCLKKGKQIQRSIYFSSSFFSSVDHQMVDALANVTIRRDDVTWGQIVCQNIWKDKNKTFTFKSWGTGLRLQMRYCNLGSDRRNFHLKGPGWICGRQRSNWDLRTHMSELLSLQGPNQAGRHKTDVARR